MALRGRMQENSCVSSTSTSDSGEAGKQQATGKKALIAKLQNDGGLTDCNNRHGADVLSASDKTW